MKVHVIAFSLGSRKGEIEGKHAGCYTFRNNFRLLCSFRTLGLNDLKIVNEFPSSFPSSPKVPSPSEPKQKLSNNFEQFFQTIGKPQGILSSPELNPHENIFP